MEQTTLSIGDLVQLRSGGPIMTITGIIPAKDQAPARFSCSWFPGSYDQWAGEVAHAGFPFQALRKHGA